MLQTHFNVCLGGVTLYGGALHKRANKSIWWYSCCILKIRDILRKYQCTLRMVNKVKQLNINKLKYWWRKWISEEGKLRRLLVPLCLSELQLCTIYKTRERSRHRCSASRCLTHFFTHFKNIMCTLFYHSSATQSVQELSTHSINRFYCHQPLSPALSLSLSCAVSHPLRPLCGLLMAAERSWRGPAGI